MHLFSSKIGKNSNFLRFSKFTVAALDFIHAWPFGNIFWHRVARGAVTQAQRHSSLPSLFFCGQLTLNVKLWACWDCDWLEKRTSKQPNQIYGTCKSVSFATLTILWFSVFQWTKDKTHRFTAIKILGRWFFVVWWDNRIMCMRWRTYLADDGCLQLKKLTELQVD